MTQDFHVFYCRHRTCDVIESYAPEPISTDHIPRLASDVLEETGDFLGLVDRDDCVLQFIYVARADDDEHPIRMEIPDVSRKRNFVRHISNAELFELLRNLPDTLTAYVVTDRDLASRDLDLTDGLDHMQPSAHQGDRYYRTGR